MTAMHLRYPFVKALMDCAASTHRGLFVFPKNGRKGERQFVKSNHVVYWVKQQVTMRYRTKGTPGCSGPESLTGMSLLRGISPAALARNPDQWVLTVDADSRPGWSVLGLNVEDVRRQLVAFGLEVELMRKLEASPQDRDALIEYYRPLLGEYFDNDLLALQTGRQPPSRTRARK